MFDPFGLFQKAIGGIGSETHGPAHTQKMNLVRDMLSIFQEFLTVSKISKPVVVDLMSHIVEEIDECSHDIDNCQVLASCSVNICLDRYSGDLTQNKILVYNRKEIKPYGTWPLIKMLTVLRLVKKFVEIEPFDFKQLSMKVTRHFLIDMIMISKQFNDVRTLVEDFITWKIWLHLRAQDILDTAYNAINNDEAPSAEVDFVFSVKCAFWPEIAKSWIVRERPFDFPSHELCQEIASHGVHIVCKNYPNGDTRLNWRLSFSEAEIKLATMRSEKQKLVYFIFKSIFYEQLKSICDEPTDTSLSSYCAKTIMMWACEKHALEFWKKTSYTICLETLFTDLEVALRTKNLPNYFIPEINLLANCESILHKALDVVTKIKKNVENYPSGKTIEELIQRTKNFEKFMAIGFEFHQQMPYLQRTGRVDLTLAESIAKMYHHFLDNMLPVKLAPVMLEFLTGKTIALPTSRPVPDHVFGISITGLQSMTQLVTGGTFGNSTFFEEIVGDLQELRSNGLLRSLVGRILLLDVDLHIKLNEVLEELNLQRSVTLELQKWFLYKLIKCMLSAKPSHELIAIANYVQGRLFVPSKTIFGSQTHIYGLVEKSMAAMEQWNDCDTSKEAQCLKVEDIEHIEQLQSGTIHFSAILSILCHFEKMINKGLVTPSSLAFIAVVKCMRRQMTERMKSDLVQMKRKPKERSLQEYEDIDLD